jgi:C_GCAxxG_C_C family probable redox protein
MSSRNLTALKLFSEGANCAQAVLAAFADDLHLDRPTALKIAASFGGGMKQGLTCGAFTGALMVLGIKHGSPDHTDKNEKEKITALTRDFAERFKRQHKCLSCTELLGIDVTTKSGHDQAAAQGLFRTRCPQFITTAVELLEKK